MILQQTTTLSNGRAMPTLGLGTWFIEDGDAAKAVRDAAEIGYRHFDSAQAYGNEAGVGEGVRTCGVPREELFVTSKLAAEAKTYDEAVRAIDSSLTTSGLDHLDLMLIHSPQPWQEFGGEDRHEKGNQEAWRALEEAYQAGKLGAIGLSNFQERDIDNVLEVATVAPMVNQVLAHITNVPSDLIAYSREKGMVVQGYSPMGHGS